MGGKYEVPSKDYAVQYGPWLPELLEELTRVILEENPVLGTSLDLFEAEFAAHAGARFGIGTGSGTDALVLAMRSLGIGKGDEVIVPANTFFATVTAVVMAGGRPVLVDPDPDTLNLSVEGVVRAVTPRTRAIIAVHLYGLLAPMAGLLEVAESLGLHLLEDAAQAHGARGADGRRAGAFGCAGCFSFHPGKNLGAFGDGGMITTSDRAVADRARQLRNLGKVTKYEVCHVAPNTKLDTLQAALLRMKLPRLDGWNGRRRRIAARYREVLEGVGDLRLPADPGGEAHVHHLFVVRTRRRDALRRHLRGAGINAGIHYPIPPHLQKLDQDLGYREGDFPVAEGAADSVLSLPISFELTDAQVDQVCDQVRRFFHG